MGGGAKGGASPPALLLRAGVSQGQSAPKSESQQTVAIPTPNAKLTNKTGEMKKWGGGKTSQNRASCSSTPGGGSSQPQGLGTRPGGLAGPALHLALRAVLIVRGPSTPAAQACDPVAHVEQHHFQRVCVHAPLVGLGSTLHVLHNSACEVFTLWGRDTRMYRRGTRVCRGHTRRLSYTYGGGCTPDVCGFISVCPYVYTERRNIHTGICMGHPPRHMRGIPTWERTQLPEIYVRDAHAGIDTGGNTHISVYMGWSAPENNWYTPHQDMYTGDHAWVYVRENTYQQMLGTHTGYLGREVQTQLPILCCCHFQQPFFYLSFPFLREGPVGSL